MIDIFFHDKTGVVSGFPGQIDGFEYADGNGEIHYYRLFDGVGIMLLRLEMEAYTEIRTQIGRLEVNFCVNGRFETSFSMRDRVLLKPGDMAVSCYDGLVRSPAFLWATTRGSVWRSNRPPREIG